MSSESLHVNTERLYQSYQTVRDHLLSQRNAAGHWVGELSTSALSTATAVMALEMVSRHPSTEYEPNQLRPLIQNGLAWLANHQNDDGGWGDTTKSHSNISTAMLARAVFRATNTEDQYADVVANAQAYIDRIGGVPAVIARYGKDKTFSVPILTHCALAGMVEWSTIPALPFELACLPARFYKTVRLPVVSYALPALIAIGQVRHHFVKSWNPYSRTIRNAARKRSLQVLERIQPTNGGFLEATPLTSFVTMSLAGMGLVDHPVVKKGVEFILDSVREDGSWPIDTNLATWVTTLSVNALGDDFPSSETDREPIRRFLLDQQYKTVHPYTNADPGGWAWTDLPGGVPDADDTPGAMLALSGELRVESGASDETIERGVRWLLGLQNRDGGFPTFCRGWGTLPFDRSSADITAHGLRALIGSKGITYWRDCIANVADGKVPRAKYVVANRRKSLHTQAVLLILFNGFRFLQNTQNADGSWFPLWFGNQHHPEEENPTYGTARVLAAYRDAEKMQSEPAVRGVQWLVSNQNDDGGWGAAKGIVSSVEETALATEILLSVPSARESASRGVEWLLEKIEDGSWTDPTPIGFYFAKLWYFEELYPQIFTVAALRRACHVFLPESEPTETSTEKLGESK